jgi:hypothetical protein
LPLARTDPEVADFETQPRIRYRAPELPELEKCYADLPLEETMKKLLSTVVATVAAVAASQAQQQTSVKVDGKDYKVTEFPGRSMHMVQLSGSEGSAMLSVQNGKITAYISPPGGGGQLDLINRVWSAYQDHKSGNAVANSNVAGHPSAGTPSSAGLTVDGVISLIDAGISADLIIAKIQKSGQTFDLSTEDMVRLKKAGASDAVMKAMMSATPAPVAVSVAPMAGPNAAVAPSVDVAPNPVAENPNMGKLKKEGFMATIGHGVSNAVNGKSVIDRLSMRNILPQWDPSQKLSAQYPHIAITVLSAPMGWTNDYRVILRKNNKLAPPCFKLKAVVWLDAARSQTTDEFEWCIEKDMFMSELQPTYLYSLAATRADYGQTTGVNRTDGPQPPDKLLPNDRATLDMEAKTNPQGASKDLNMDANSLFAIMFANVRKDLGETLGSDGDYRVWITTIKKAAGPPLF